MASLCFFLGIYIPLIENERLSGLSGGLCSGKREGVSLLEGRDSFGLFPGVMFQLAPPLPDVGS